MIESITYFLLLIILTGCNISVYLMCRKMLRLLEDAMLHTDSAKHSIETMLGHDPTSGLNTRLNELQKMKFSYMRTNSGGQQ
ncbi:MAG: hypothetical protein EBR82_00275 [Caulobacteraceae bacterium]|nr:hypothetical protein [Caulobacteraceae bacterium]